jgi:arylsulfatase A-like enzyme
MRFLSSCFALLVGLSLGAAEKPNSPNILFIAVDDLNDWPAFLNGHPDAKTPNMDRLARRGTSFRDAHCQFPLCGPSRASVFAGLLPTTLGVFDHLKDNELEKIATAQGTPLLHRYFGDAGYKTMAVGKLCHTHVPTGSVDLSGGREPFGPNPKPGYNWVSDKTSTDWQAWPERDGETADFRTAQWTIDRLGEAHEKPFLLMTGFLRPHVPWFVPQPWFDLHRPGARLHLPPYQADDWNDIPAFAKTIAQEPQYPTTEWAIEHEQWANIVQAYLACVSYVDHYVGEVLDALDRSPYANNTIVMLWSDHGYHLGEKGLFKKVTLWNRSTHVPLIIAGPGLPENQVCDRVVSLVDLYPTLVDLAGLPANGRNEGHSLRPLLNDPTTVWDHAAITTLFEGNHSATTTAYRYIRYKDGSEELYDRRQDPHEWKNLATDSKLAATKARLAQLLPD